MGQKKICKNPKILTSAVYENQLLALLSVRILKDIERTVTMVMFQCSVKRSVSGYA